MITKFLTDMMTKPGYAPLFDSPSNYGLAYKDVTFTTEDGITIAAWLINPGQSRVIIQSHFGVASCRAGLTLEGKPLHMRSVPYDIHFLKHIKALADAGYTVLAYDMRNHGESGQSAQKLICDGQEEYKDLQAAVKYVSSHPDYASASIGLLSMCMGSSATAWAHGGDNGLEHNKQIKAMVLLQPLYSGAFFDALKIPRFLTNRAAKRSVKLGGVDFRQSPVGQFKLFKAPTMVIQNTLDPMTRMDYVKDCFEALNVKKEMVWTTNEKNRFSGYKDLGEHPEKMIGWFDTYMK